MRPRDDLRETLVVFRGDEMLINNFQKQSGWFVGDMQNGLNVQPYCSIVRVDPMLHGTNLLDGIISGGYMKGFGGCQNVISFRLVAEEQNCVQTINCNYTEHLPFLPSMLERRFMHQSCIIKGRSGYWTLLLLGGKATQNEWSNTCESLDLWPTF